MKRTLSLVVLAAFLLYTGVYIFIYLWRAFRIPSSGPRQSVMIWHGDPFARAILVGVLFIIGLVVLLYVALSRQQADRSGHVRLRQDLFEWLQRESEQANESPSRLAERAVAAYRRRLEGSG